MLERLQKLISAAGVASRRQAEELIRAGDVSVNGQVVTELGTKADPERDHIKVRGRLINSQLASGREKVYVLLNKPRGYLTSLSDPEGRPLVSEFVPPAMGRLHPVGRLDFNTEGLLILTNDGELTNYITAARNKVPKVYEAKVKGIPPEDAVERLRRGVVLEDGVKTAPAQVTRTGETESNAWVEIVLHEGRNQQIRRMFDVIGHSVVKLRRVAVGRVRDERLKPGMWRRLTASEVSGLMRGARRGAGGEGGQRQRKSGKDPRDGGGERRRGESVKGAAASGGPDRRSKQGLKRSPKQGSK
ncbi:MAG TPA: pseudouridine synthase [Pyrinomonadaceae bacterium]|nr:pseudouridine synthase [Pyrinomonadaceae bacterium]